MHSRVYYTYCVHVVFRGSAARRDAFVASASPDYRGKTDAGISVARSEMLGEIIATEFTYFHANSHRRRRGPTVLSLSSSFDVPPFIRLRVLNSRRVVLPAIVVTSFVSLLVRAKRSLELVFDAASPRPFFVCLGAAPRPTKHAEATEFFLRLFPLFRRRDE